MTRPTASVSLHTGRTISDISPLIFGGFAEHMGRCIYEGIYDPASPLADERGFRPDVMQALKEIQFRIMRYPGGNFVSGYRWQDGIGPKEKRPRRRALAWRSTETNQFGLHEFMEFAQELNTLPMWAVNLGTGTIQEAADLVEYMNLPTGTYFSDLRASNGHADPYGVKYWCLGNEMDGPWQIGHMDAATYADKAVEAAKLMRWTDPSIKLIACGSSNTGMPTYPDWDRTVLERTGDHIDYFSMHYYVGNPSMGAGEIPDTDSYLASSVQFESHTDTIAAAIRLAKAKNRSKKDVFLCWDEWNVWYRETGGDGNWSEAPHILEEVYNLEDALVVAQWLSTFLRKADVIKVACIAQIVNVIAPIMTNSNAMFRQTIFYPLALFSNHAAGQALDVLVKAPLRETKLYGDVPQLDASASFDAQTGRGALFLVNRSQTEALDVTLTWDDTAPQSFTQGWQMSGSDPKAANSFATPDAVTTHEIDLPKLDGNRATLTLPPLSFTTLLSQHPEL
ncbi:alpha-N-arabinofuranosidase [Deinococcus ruber]|uniref:non-reducing end alpha-L-arabinofuranosidase n=1 Tax=Deinococcus ruber TaxID=1848197 RepID=A0A918FBE3_9DEIO|nr:alpha-N-arabinofuranosidase [Deinococcus ruber]GGR18858.1 intracellular exo-alpha-(1->5)-L-arabinofuranosidase 1 [Deinococcus ruber]